MKQKLPEYMIPGVFVRLYKMPLLSSGKADRKTLASQPVELPSAIGCP